MVGPADEGLIAHAHRDHDARVGIGQLDAIGDLALIVRLLFRLPAQPHPQHDPQAEPMVPDGLKHILGVLVRAIETDDPPIPFQDAQVLQDLIGTGEHLLVGILSFAISGIADRVASRQHVNPRRARRQ